jgi:hypothetical protein
VDKAFLKWLRELIGDQEYKKLDPHIQAGKASSNTLVGEHMRELLKGFEQRKRRFASSPEKEIPIDLTGDLANLNIKGKVDGGEIRIPL